MRLLILQDHKKDFEQERELLKKIDNQVSFKQALRERVKCLSMQDVVSQPYSGYVNTLTCWMNRLKRCEQNEPANEFHKETLLICR